jgi:signal transduction histidine kinase
MTRLLQVTSQELRSPLTAVKGYASTLIDYYDRLDEGIRRNYVAGILSATHHLEILVSDILTFSRIEGGNLQLNLTQVSLGDFLERALESHRLVTPFHEFHLTVHEPDPEVAVDTVRLLQIVDNVLENAVRHGGAPVTIDVATKGRYATVTITDEGPGVPQGSLESIFEPFVRVENPATPQTRGTGLGLSVCKGIVEKHGGNIWAEQPPVTGCRVTFTLPLRPTG